MIVWKRLMSCGENVILDEDIFVAGLRSRLENVTIAYYCMLSYHHAYGRQRLRSLASETCHATPSQS
jgi:hypothetical protein